MAILSTRKSRRLRPHHSETIRQVIVFQIQREWFALPIFAVKKVVPKSDTHGDYHGSGAGLTIYEGRELLVLDVNQQVFGGTSPQLVPALAAEPAHFEPTQFGNGYLLIIRDRKGELVGLPIEAAPTVRRIAQSDIVPLPANYAARVNIQCVSGLIIQSDNQSILFLLNPDQLLQAQPLLPPAF
ncbi:chemotaxis protein CheW [Leptolyngbya cf. ectocarpi LEGE 11479]|uniref:Chemotaxis protein CheW n=1 Tax=Leptolyngbya cf. ectocarpi LEGE 11479 TaxID=1828722 RepID=A0A928ZYS9_LEPEC|nr:chemotaxis protein CheW [Leptolyngbya ectocarpi]MBE9069926.1 chemotaxis protein CheW [Leptolyngbya cf. ectocarpi LEGE 11479]